MQLDAAAYVAMLEDLDAEVGRILEALDDAGVAENTIVIFVSDNGGFAGAGNMGPLRGSKGTTHEGGIRVPLIIRWPKNIRPNTTSEQVCVTFDLTKSILELSGADVGDKQLDGIDVITHVAEHRDDVPRTLFWRGRRGMRTWTAVRDGDMKWVQKREGNKTEQWLYDLATDIGEGNDLAASRPADFRRLQTLLNKWEEEVAPVR